MTLTRVKRTSVATFRVRSSVSTNWFSPLRIISTPLRPLRRSPQARANEGTLVTGIALDHVCSPGGSRARAFERAGATTEWPFAGPRGRSAVRFRRLHPKQEPSCWISIFIGVNVAVHAVTAFWAAAKTSRADVVPATCSVPHARLMLIFESTPCRRHLVQA